jgi:hypothetical protein
MLVRTISTLRNSVFPGALVALLSLSCASKPTSGGPGTYRGVLASTTEIGTMLVTVADGASGPLPASGTVDFGGRVVSLSGTLDQSNASLSLASTDGLQLTGASRPGYVFGSYTYSSDSGTFALIPDSADSRPAQLFCGSFVDTSTTGNAPSQTFPFAVAAAPSGAAICVALDSVWFGSLYGNDALSCGTGGSLISGNVNADGGNQWGTGIDDQGNGDYGTWTVAPCGSSAADGGVDSSTDNGPDAGTSDLPAGEVD